jgi:hypothetical protein
MAEAVLYLDGSEIARLDFALESGDGKRPGNYPRLLERAAIVLKSLPPLEVNESVFDEFTAELRTLKRLPTPKKERHLQVDRSPITGRIISPAWAALLMRASVFDMKMTGPRRALAWAKKPPTNGAREVARRLRQMAAA